MIKTYRYLKIFCLLCSLILIGCEPVKPLSLSIDTDKNNYRPNEQISLNVVLKNNSYQPINILRHIALEHYPFNIEVTISDGRALKFLGSEISLDYEDSMFSEIASGDSYTTHLNISLDDENEMLFDFTKAGTYTIQLSYRSPHDRLIVDSNEIELTILE